MGIYIKIAKYKESDATGYYEVSTKDFHGAHFYIGIDKSTKIISVYESKKLDVVLGQIDCNDVDKPIKTFGDISIAILSRVIMRSIKVFDMNIFPDFLSYEA